MSLPKKVAIIGIFSISHPRYPQRRNDQQTAGAGPSGLVTAKTLLHNFPTGTFHPTIFEKKHHLGGLWAVDYPSDRAVGHSHRPKRGYVDPYMRTNISRFSVAFSDLAWESALGGGDGDVPMFPRAWQVRRYLEKYVGNYVPDEAIKLGRRVVKTVRTDRADARWEVQWVDERENGSASAQTPSEPEIKKESFDFLVVASGHFGTPHTPDIPGLDGSPSIVHSSELQSADDVSRLLEQSPAKQGKLVVVGGSMSGVEAATSIALHLSSLKFKPGSSEQVGSGYEVWHLSTSPFWVLPTYLPHQYSGDPSKTRTMPILPLDLFLYDLSRRPAGTVNLAYGPKSPEQVSAIYKSFRDMLGNDYSQIGGVNITDANGKESTQPPWVGIADYYAEFVRSGAIKLDSGRARSVTRSASSWTIHVETPDGHRPLTNVAAIVMATGFSPSRSLSFLDKDVLRTLEHSEQDHFLPLILDGFSSSHADIPDLGFVGFYKGVFWGPAELQAQSLAQRWNPTDAKDGTTPVDDGDAGAAERDMVRAFRNFQPANLRGQFPLGDYVGLMESLARRLGRARKPLAKEIPEDAQPLGPVVPVRYHFDRDVHTRESQQARGEVDTTMDALRRTLTADSERARMCTAVAIFRALHGQWSFTIESGQGVKASGTATFHPRYPSSPGYEREYLCEALENGTQTRSIYRLSEDTSELARDAQVHIWSADQQQSPNSASLPLGKIQFETSAEVTESGDYRVRAFDIANPGARYRYEFILDRVAIRSWSCTVTRPGSSDGQSETETHTSYTRS
ncbi:hypothetical protein BJX63DRAFT_284173 [Aspergillus granulosus]|uniref:FAD/NAD(P)-binding domain-containing protein n=1 Tax=Aspergillus granulosus TaxID=176169 RepID=A0ABR4HZ66_9EURO